jgi:hypothetical protein
VHPIERLRYVARAGWAGPGALGAEAAYALAELAEHEPAAVLPACRRLLERNPGCGPLWWVAARLCVAGDLVAEAERCAEELDDDPTGALLDAALAPEARVVRHGGIAEATSADVVLLETDAMGPTGLLLDPDDCGLLEAARVCEADIWVVAGTGRVLPLRLWEALLERLETARPGVRRARHAFDDDVEPRRGVVVELRGVARVAGPFGVRSPVEALALSSCPEPPELTARW